MRKHYSLELSDKILDKLFQIFGDDYGGHGGVVVECWSNGREQGYSLLCYETNRRVCFAMQRNSDQIIIYEGPVNEFDLSTNQPMNRKIWERGKCFSEIDSAVAYIVEKTGVIDRMVRK